NPASKEQEIEPPSGGGWRQTVVVVLATRSGAVVKTLCRFLFSGDMDGEQQCRCGLEALPTIPSSFSLI
ncbi:hypothetical protein U1Q18_036538, partial [Sarracenia purpurea var. burkii]